MPPFVMPTLSDALLFCLELPPDESYNICSKRLTFDPLRENDNVKRLLATSRKGRLFSYWREDKATELASQEKLFCTFSRNKLEKWYRYPAYMMEKMPDRFIKINKSHVISSYG